MDLGPAYPGDRALERLLAAAGNKAASRIATAREARALIRGVLAAPAGIDDQAWLGLVAERPPAVLKTALLALKDRMAAAPGPAGLAPGDRLPALRAALKVLKVDGLVVPRSDSHQGEYVPASEERLAWLTGFTGSAGMAVVLPEQAALFVDGRYTLQARKESDPRAFSIQHVTRMPPARWVEANLRRGQTLGFDPWLLTPAAVDRFEAAAARAGGRLKALPRNPIDRLWHERPAPPLSAMRPLALKYAGRSAAEKCRKIAAALAADDVRAAVLSAPDSIAWLLNIRGGDLTYAPLCLAFAVIGADGRVELFTDPRKLTASARKHLGPKVRVRPVSDLGAALDRLGRTRRAVQIDPAGTPYWITRRLARAGAAVRTRPDPCQTPKACKNRVELNGIRAAHLRDGAALTRFLAWLAGAAPKGGLTEMTAANRLEAMRRENALFQGLSFPTISGAGPNGAIVHYRVTIQTDRRLKRGEIYLLDSGAQYLDGTTDVTRTVFIAGGLGPTAAMKDHVTRVLKGHIALARVRFPRGTSGSQLDVLARRALWEAGLEYDHGTGHGVGHFLNVHEGPQRISQIPNAVALRPGMVVSNEPGYYKAGAYGIRIENLMAVVPAGKAVDGREMHAFETLTLAPIDRSLITKKLLDGEERAWLDAYHERVRKAITPLVDAKTASWLRRATAPI